MSDRKDWFSTPRLSRAEFVELLRRSENEIQQRNKAFRFKYVYVDFHTVREHEREIGPRLKGILARTDGRVEFKHRGIMREFHGAFRPSKAIDLTRDALKTGGLIFAEAHMSGDYYTPVDAQQAATWKDASRIPNFGLKYPPSIVFIRKEGEQDAGGKRE